MPASDPYPISAKIVGGLLIALVLLSMVTVTVVLCDPARAELTIQSIDGISPERAGRMLSIEDEVQRVFGLPRPIVLVDQEEDKETPSPSPSQQGRGISEPSPLAGEGRERGIYTLTQEEYDGLKEMLRISGATPLQVGLVKAAVVGVTVFAACFGFILALTILRYIFNRWFDAHIYDSPPLSTVVVTAIIVMLGIVVYGAVAVG